MGSKIFSVVAPLMGFFNTFFGRAIWPFLEEGVRNGTEKLTASTFAKVLDRVSANPAARAWFDKGLRALGGVAHIKLPSEMFASERDRADAEAKLNDILEEAFKGAGSAAAGTNRGTVNGAVASGVPVVARVMGYGWLNNYVHAAHREGDTCTTLCRAIHADAAEEQVRDELVKFLADKLKGGKRDDASPPPGFEREVEYIGYDAAVEQGFEPCPICMNEFIELNMMRVERPETTLGDLLSDAELECYDSVVESLRGHDRIVELAIIRSGMSRVVADPGRIRRLKILLAQVEPADEVFTKDGERRRIRGVLDLTTIDPVVNVFRDAGGTASWYEKARQWLDVTHDGNVTIEYRRKLARSALKFGNWVVEDGGRFLGRLAMTLALLDVLVVLAFLISEACFVSGWWGGLSGINPMWWMASGFFGVAITTVIIGVQFHLFEWLLAWAHNAWPDLDDLIERLPAQAHFLKSKKGEEGVERGKKTARTIKALALQVVVVHGVYLFMIGCAHFFNMTLGPLPVAYTATRFVFFLSFLAVVLYSIIPKGEIGVPLVDSARRLLNHWAIRSAWNFYLGNPLILLVAFLIIPGTWFANYMGLSQGLSSGYTMAWGQDNEGVKVVLLPDGKAYYAHETALAYAASTGQIDYHTGRSGERVVKLKQMSTVPDIMDGYDYRVRLNGSLRVDVDKREMAEIASKQLAVLEASGKGIDDLDPVLATYYLDSEWAEGYEPALTRSGPFETLTGVSPWLFLLVVTATVVVFMGGILSWLALRRRGSKFGFAVFACTSLVSVALAGFIVVNTLSKQYGDIIAGEGFYASRTVDWIYPNQKRERDVRRSRYEDYVAPKSSSDGSKRGTKSSGDSTSVRPKATVELSDEEMAEMNAILDELRR